MTFEEPVRLIGLVVPLALTIWFLVARNTNRRSVVRFTSLDLVDRVAPRRPGWRRVVTAVAAVMGVVVLALAFARPVVAVPVAREQASIVLAVDVSLSMGADDVEPTRIAAAQEAARDFVDGAPQELRIGLVAFAGTALPVLQPTADHDLVTDAVGRLGLGEGTAVGEAVHSSLEMLGPTLDVEAPAVVVVLSDGETTVGRSELEAAGVAAADGVTIHTIAFGTPDGVVSVQGDLVPVPVAEGALREVADATGGSFHRVADDAALTAILDDIGSEVAIETDDVEITDWMTALGLVSIAVAVAGSIRWFGRIA